MTVALRKTGRTGIRSEGADGRDQRITRTGLSGEGKECVEDLKKVMGDMEEIIYQECPGGEAAAEAPASGNAKESDGSSERLWQGWICALSWRRPRPSKGPK